MKKLFRAIFFLLPSTHFVAQDYGTQKINLVENYDKFGEREQLGSAINSLFDEHHPVISSDGKYLFVNRYDNPDNTGGIKDKGDIWISELRGNNWTWLHKMDSTINNSETNYISGISADNNTILLGGTYPLSFDLRDEIFISNKSETGWSYPEALYIDKYFTNAPFTSACISADKNIVIVSLQRHQKQGNVDMYVCFRKTDNSWTEPKNLGPVINSEHEDFVSYLAVDMKTLYFFSDGHPGYGNADIFVSKRLDDSWTNWSIPQNMGPHINSKNRDSFFSISAKGDYAYFSSIPKGRKDLDIYRIQLPKTAAPEPVVLLRGKVFNEKTKAPLNCQMKLLVADPGNSIQNFESAGDSGNFITIIHRAGKYDVAANRPGFISIHKSIEIKEIKTYNEIEVDIFLTPVETGQTIILKNIFFSPNKFELLPASNEELNKLVNIMKDNPNLKIQVSGHTSANNEGERFNLELSSNRALAVKNYLVQNGIEDMRIDYKGFGFSKPVFVQEDEEHKAMNRRVEFTIISK